MPDGNKSANAPIDNSANSQEGVHNTQQPDGTTHETKWYSNEYSSYRTSRNIDQDGNESDKHTKKNR